MTLTRTVAAIDRLDVTGLEFGRLLVTAVFTAVHLPRRDRLRLTVECSCGVIFNVAARHLVSGNRSMCASCFRAFHANYGSAPEKEPLTLDTIQEMAARREREEAEYLRLKRELGL